MEIIEKQKGLGIHQVPITTKPPLTELLHINEVTRSDFKNKEESPYKPETMFQCSTIGGLAKYSPIIARHFLNKSPSLNSTVWCSRVSQ